MQTRAIVPADLVVPAFQISITAWLSQWRMTVLRAQWCPQVLTVAVIAKSSSHTIFIFAFSDDQQACIHLPQQYTPILLSQQHQYTMTWRWTICFLACRRCHSRMEGESVTILYRDECVGSTDGVVGIRCNLY